MPCLITFVLKLHHLCYKRCVVVDLLIILMKISSSALYIGHNLKGLLYSSVKYPTALSGLVKTYISCLHTNYIVLYPVVPLTGIINQIFIFFRVI